MFAPPEKRKPGTVATIPGWSGHVISSRPMSVRRPPDPAGRTLKSASTLPPRAQGQPPKGPGRLLAAAGPTRPPCGRPISGYSSVRVGRRQRTGRRHNIARERPVAGHKYLATKPVGPGAPGSPNGQEGQCARKPFCDRPQNGPAGFGAPLIVRHPKPGVACAQGADRALAARRCRGKAGDRDRPDRFRRSRCERDAALSSLRITRARRRHAR